MSIESTHRPYPFADRERRDKYRLVGGSSGTAGSVVQLVTGKNGTGSAVDGVAAGEWFSDFVVPITNANYPSTGLSGVSAQEAPFLGILEEATADDGYGAVCFVGLVSVTVVQANAVVYQIGSFVYLDASNSWAITVADAANNPLAAGDIVVGKLATGYTASGTSSTQDVLWDGINSHRAL